MFEPYSGRSLLCGRVLTSLIVDSCYKIVSGHCVSLCVMCVCEGGGVWGVSVCVGCDGGGGGGGGDTDLSHCRQLL